jgi:hypothetical protein
VKRQRFYLTMLLILLSAVAVSAADISGKWVAQVPGRQGDPIETTFTFKVDAGKLTGTVSANYGGQAREQQITEGKVSGDDVTFVTVFSFPGGGGGGGGEMKFVYKGKVAGSEIKLSRSFEGGPGGGGGGGMPAQEFVAKKVN